MPKQVNGGAAGLPTGFSRRGGKPGSKAGADRTDHDEPLMHRRTPPAPEPAGDEAVEPDPVHPAAQAIIERRKRKAAEYSRVMRMSDAEFAEFQRHSTVGHTDHPTCAAPPSPPSPGSRRRQDLATSQWPDGGRHRAPQGGTGMSEPTGERRQRLSWVAEEHRQDRQRAAERRRGGGDIQDMRTDFPRVVHQGRQAIEEAAANLRQHVASITDGSPSNQAVKDAANAWAQQVEALAAKADDIIGLSRQADAVGYEAAERYDGDPNRGAWMGQG